MPNISQIEIDNTTYGLCDTTARSLLYDISDALIWNGSDGYIKGISGISIPQGSSSPIRGRLYTDPNDGGICFSTAAPENNSLSYIFSLFADTGSLRLDSYNHSTEERKILGYIPLTNSGTDNCVKVISNTSLITPTSNWTITACNIAQWGQIVQVSISAKNTSAISVTAATGNITNITIGTIAEKYRPKNFHAVLASTGDGIGPAWGYLTINGGIEIGAFEGRNASYTIAANSNIYLRTIYVAAMDTDQLL